MEYHKYCLTPFVRSYAITPEGINSFLSSLTCGNAKVNYYGAIKTFCNWLYKQGYTEANPITKVDKPLTSKKLLPAITEGQLEVILSQANSLRDRCILGLLFDGGLRVGEVCSIKPDGTDWSSSTLKVVVKGNREAKAVFTPGTATLHKEYLSSNGHNPKLFDIKPSGTQTMPKRLSKETGMACNPHSFRRGFACNLHRKGLST